MVNNSLNRPPKVDQRKPSVKQINKSSIVTPNETIEDFIIQVSFYIKFLINLFVSLILITKHSFKMN